MKRIRVLLVDDEPRIRRGLAMRLGLEPDLEIVGEAEDGASAIALTRELDPDIVLMDLNMRGMDGMTATRLLCDEAPESAVVVLTLHDDATTRREATAAGARAFVGKQEGSTYLVTVIRNLCGAA